MKLYRVSLESVQENNLGFVFCETMEKAKKARHEFEAVDHEDRSATIEVIEFEPTVDAVFTLLNRYGSHPDNG